MVDSSIINYIIGGGGTCCLALILILTNILVPKPYHQVAVKEVERLRQVNDKLAEANEQLRQANIQLASSGQLTNQVMTALLSLADRQQAAIPAATAADPGHPGQLEKAP